MLKSASMHENFWNRLLLVSIPFAIISIFWVPHGVEVTAVIIALSALYEFKQKHRYKSDFDLGFSYLFFVALFFTALLAIYHWKMIDGDINQYGKTLGKIFVLAIGILLIDFSSFLSERLKLEMPKLAKIFIYVVALSTLARILFVYFSGGSDSFLDVFSSNNRQAFLAGGLNPNHADDIFMIYLTLLGFSVSILMVYRKLSWPLLALAVLTGMYLIMSVFDTGSQAALVGVVAGFLFVLFLAILNKDKRVFYFIVVSVGLFTIAGLSHLSKDLSKLVSHNEKLIYKQMFSDARVNQSASNHEALLGKRHDQKRMDHLRNNTHAYFPIIKINQTISPVEKINSNVSDLVFLKDIEALKKYSRTELLKICIPAANAYAQKIDIPFDLNAKHRIALWEIGFKLWKVNPIFGWGGDNKIRMVEAAKIENPCSLLAFSHVHNFYLDLLIRGGLVLLVGFVIVFGSIVVLLAKVGSKNKETLLIMVCPLIGVIYLLVQNFFDLSMMRNTALLNTFLLNFIILGVAFGEAKKQITSEL